MSGPDRFLKRLATNPDDTTTRLVYADWLDEHGEHEEADRQRKWPAAREWLVRLCRETSQHEYRQTSYEELIEFGNKAVQEANTTKSVHLNNESIWDALKSNSQEFWKNWSIVTGSPVPPEFENKGFYHWQCCPGEDYQWFGEPPSED
jgi:uncharacterized protein (TIGR02996 family)